ncbi:MAG: DUF3466 family protein [candidate division Zixibacteria bacterium]|nr:DUF3466 family protein [candidate division Zixibacteria bacterium]
MIRQFPVPRIFVTVLVVAFFICGKGQAQFVYQVTDLGQNLTPYDINNSAQVVGRAEFSGNSACWKNGWTPFIFSNDSLKFPICTDAIISSGIFYDAAVGINNSGQTVGVNSIRFIPRVAINDKRSFIWDGANVTFHGDIPGQIANPRTVFQGINDAGTIVASNWVLVTEITPTDTFINWSLQAVLVDGVTHKIIDSSIGLLPGGFRSFGHAINNNNHVVGVGNTSNITINHAFFWDGATLTEINPAGTGSSSAHSINDHDQVVGMHQFNYSAYTLGQTVNSRAFLWEGGTFTDLETLPGATRTVAWEINNSGEIVGFSSDANGFIQPVLWLLNPAYDLPAGIHKLRELIDPGSGWTLRDLYAINDIGQIVGRANNLATGRQHGVILTPAPPPGLIVNSTGDAPDVSPGDGNCNTGGPTVAGAPECTMRAAIMEANALAGPDTIKFNIPGVGIPVIRPRTSLPEITDPVVIDGSTQPSVNQVEINGSDVLSGDGLIISAGKSVIKYLILNNFPQNGLTLLSGDSNSIENSYFGVGSDGIEAKGNEGHGLLISNSSGNKIGDAVLNRKNFIGFNKRAGVFVESGTGNTIRGNSIYGNFGVGIDLAPEGMNRNDSGDADNGANKLTNYPNIDTVEIGPVSRIIGSFNAEANKSYQLDIYLNDPVDASNFGDGKKLIQSAPVLLDADGNVSFSISAVATPRSDQFITMTATDPDGNTSEFSLPYPLIKKLRLLDARGNPIMRKRIRLLNPHTNGVAHTRDTIDFFVVSDNDGVIDIADLIQSTVLFPGDTVVVGADVTLGDHRGAGATLETMHISLDNTEIDNKTFQLMFDTLTDDSLQEIVLDHSHFGFGLEIGIQWDVSVEFKDSLLLGMRRTANYFYDLFDGQVTIDQVHLVDNLDNGRLLNLTGVVFSKDIFITTSNSRGVSDGKPGLIPIIIPRRYFFDRDQRANLSANEYPIHFSSSENWRRLANQLGKYLFGFAKESRRVPGSNCSERFDYGFIGWPFHEDNSASSEMSTALVYQDASCRGTEQYRQYVMSCWELFEKKFERTYAGVYVPVNRPGERTLAAGAERLDGPNEHLSGSNVVVNYNVGNEMFFDDIAPFPPAAFDELWILEHEPGIPLAGGNMIVVPFDKPGVSYNHGHTSDDGRIWLVGLEPGDKVLAGGAVRVSSTNLASGRASNHQSWRYGSWIVSGSGSGTSVTVQPVLGDFRLICGASQLDPTGFEYRIRTSQIFASNPTLEYAEDSNQIVFETFALADSVYSALLNTGVSASGNVRIIAPDTALNLFFFTTDYTLQRFGDSVTVGPVHSSDGAAEFNLDTSNTLTRALVLSSPFPIIRSGLDLLSLQTGSTHSLATFPASTLIGTNSLTISYNRGDFTGQTGFTSESSVRIFRWNEQLRQWELIGGEVDTVFGEVSVPITEPGVYAAFTTSTSCCSTPGDANSDGKVNIADVQFVISWLFAGGTSPSCCSEGSANGDDKLNIADVSYVIAWLFTGGSDPLCGPASFGC